jgi:membrane protein
MSKLIDKFLGKVVTVSIVIMVIAVFRGKIINNDTVGEFFGGLMEQLPFAKIISDVICNIMGYKQNIPLFTPSWIVTDLIRLAFMAFLYQVLAIPIELFTYLFILPKNKREKEEYKDTAGYKVRRFLADIMTVPIVAVLASIFSKFIFSCFVSWVGEIMARVLGVLLTSSFFMVSLVSILKSGHSFIFAIVWRIIDILVENMVKTMFVNICCIALYVGIIHGADGLIASSIITLIVFLLVIDVAIGFLRESIVDTDSDYWYRHR